MVEGHADWATMVFLSLCKEPVAISASALATACSLTLMQARNKHDIGHRIKTILAKAAPVGFGATPGAYRLVRFGHHEVRAYPLVARALLDIPEDTRAGAIFAQVATSAYVQGFTLVLLDVVEHRNAMIALERSGILLAYDFI